jgi:hypothetical protein
MGIWFWHDSSGNGGIPFMPEDLSGYVGFVYLITRIDTGRKYIGQKKFSRRITRKPLKGKKRKRVDWLDSDWQNYWSSNKTLQEEVESVGEEKFRREILHLCKSKAELNYLELKEQILADAILKPNEYYNEYCGGRISRKQLSKFIQERSC